MGLTNHDAYRQSTSQNVAFSASGGTSVQSTAFATQTRWIRLCLPVANATASGVRYLVGDNPTVTTTSPLLPPGWVEVVRCTPGQKVAVLSNDTNTGTAATSLNVTELGD